MWHCLCLASHTFFLCRLAWPRVRPFARDPPHTTRPTGLSLITFLPSLIITISTEVLKRLSVPWVAVVSMDSFYNPLSPEQSKAAFRNEHDFDSPGSFDYDLLREVIEDIRACRSVQIPDYSFVLHNRTDKSTYLYGAGCIILEGLFVLHDPNIREVLDLKVFVQCDSDLMLARRLRRDLVERGRDPAGVLDQYVVSIPPQDRERFRVFMESFCCLLALFRDLTLTSRSFRRYLRFVKPSFDNHIQPTSRFADIIVPGFNNETSVDLLASHIRRQLDERKQELRRSLFRDTEDRDSDDTKSENDGLPSTVTLMEQTVQIRVSSVIHKASAATAPFASR